MASNERKRETAARSRRRSRLGPRIEKKSEDRDRLSAPSERTRWSCVHPRNGLLDARAIIAR